MRLLRIDDVGDQAASIELHPQVTVIEGLRGAARARIIAGLRGLSDGQIDGLGGEIEAQGVRFDLTAESLGMLDLPSGLDVVVQAHHLPGVNVDGERSMARRRALEIERDELVTRLAAAEAAVVAAEADRTEATAALAEARHASSGPSDDSPSLADAVAEADRRLEDARAALGAADDALAQAEAAYAALGPADGDDEDSIAALLEQHAELQAATGRSVDAVDSAQASLDPGAAAALVDAQHELAEAETALAAFSPGAEPESVGEPSDEVPSFLHAAPAGDPEQVAALLARKAAAADELSSLVEADADSAAVVAAVDRAAAATGGGADDTALGLALADQWDEIAAHLGDLGIDPGDIRPSAGGDGAVFADPDDESDDLVAARFRVTQARRQLADAQASVTNEPLDPAEVAALEAAHVEVLEAQEKSESRFGGAKARRRLTDAREAEQTILDRLHFATYAEFMMSSSRSISVADEGLVEAARNAVADAEQALEAITPSAGDDEPLSDGESATDAVADWNEVEVQNVRQRMTDLQADIAKLLGHPVTGDPTAELRSLESVAEAGDPGIALRQALTQVGMALEDADFQTDTLVALARVWLAEQTAADARRAELTRELAEVDGELAALGVEADRAAEAEPVPEAETATPDAPDDPDAAEREAARRRRDEAAAAVEAAEARVAAHDAMVDEVVLREAEFADALAAEDELAARISDLEANREAAAAATQADRQSAAEAVQVAESARAAALAAEQEAVAARAELPDEVEAEAEVIDPVPGLEARLAAATALVGSASAEVRTVEGQLARIDRQLAELAADERDASDHLPDDHLTEEVLEEIEWYLLSRLADQRQVSVAGSLPLVLDDPFRGLTAAETTRLVSGIERMAGAVQLIVLSDDRTLVDWAEGLEPARAGVVRVS